MPKGRPKLRRALPPVRCEEETQRMCKDAESAPPEKSTPTRRLEFEPTCSSPSPSTGDVAMASAMHACDGNLAAFLSAQPCAAVSRAPLVLAPDESEGERLTAPPTDLFESGTFDNEAEEREIIPTAVGHGDEELFPVEDPLALPETTMPLTLTMQDSTLPRNAMQSALPETPDNGLGKIEADEILGSYGTHSTASSEHKHDEEFAIPPPLVNASCGESNNNGHNTNSEGEVNKKEEEEEEDAPLFPNNNNTKSRWSGENGSLDTSRAASFAVGMRVEARWGCRWFLATIAEAERNGYVQVRWDEDGSLLHLRTREVRHVTSVLTGTQLVTLMDEEDNATKSAGQKEQSYEHIVLYLSPAARSRLSDDRLTTIGSKRKGVGIGIMDFIAERGAILVNGLEAVETTIASHPHMSLWFVVANDTTIDDETAIAHAMGVAALSIDWLERLSAMGITALEAPPTPTVRDSIGYTQAQHHHNKRSEDCKLVCCQPVPRASRILYGKIVYVAGTKDSSATALLTACGASVTRVPPVSLTPHAPHYVYVAPGTHAHLDPCLACVALLEHEQLLHRIREFFLALPPAAGAHSGAIPGAHGPPGAARPRESLSRGNTPRPRGDEAAAPRVPDGSHCGHGAKRWRAEECDGRGASRSPAPREGSRVLVAAGGRLDVVEGEDYYFRAARNGVVGVAADVLLGRVVHVRPSAAQVTLRLYEVKRTALRQNARSGEVERQTIVYLSERVATVPIEDLIFETPVYVVCAAQMQHVYTLESPPREDTEDCGPRLSLSGKGTAALDEVLVNGWRISPGVVVRFCNPLAPLSEEGRDGGEKVNQGCVQVIQRAANGVVLVVHAMKESKSNSKDAGEVKVVAITPDMITGIV